MKTNRLILSEEQLIDAIRSKSPAGAETLYAMYAKSLFGIISGIIDHKETAEDMLQETFIRIWNRIDQYDAEKGRLFTWMVTIARNLSRDTLRSKTYKQGRNTTPLEDRIEVIEHIFAVEPSTDTIGIKGFLNSLKKEQLQIFNLIYYKGYTHQEVAEILAIPLGTVKTRWRLGIMRLRIIYGYGLKVEEPALVA